ncbi:hypothetical protein D3C71_1282480 [compost metagenome]
MDKPTASVSVSYKIGESPDQLLTPEPKPRAYPLPKLATLPSHPVGICPIEEPLPGTSSEPSFVRILVKLPAGGLTVVPIKEFGLFFKILSRCLFL